MRISVNRGIKLAITMVWIIPGCLMLFAGCAIFSDFDKSAELMIHAFGKGKASPADIKPDEAPAQDGSFELRRLEANDNDHTGRLPKWADETIEAKTSAAFPQGSTSYMEGVMLARQSARDQALQQLAVLVAGLPAQHEQTDMGTILAKAPNERAEVERIIRTAEIAMEDSRESSSSTCTARLSLQPIALVMQGKSASIKTSNGEKFEQAKNVELPDDPLQKAAFDRAMQNARQDMLKKLKLVRLSETESVAGLIKKNQDAAERVHRAIEYIRLDDIQHPAKGICEVDISLNATPMVSDLQSLMGQENHEVDD